MRSILIGAVPAAILCLIILVSRSGSHAKLKNELKSEQQTVAKLERDLSRPVGTPLLTAYSGPEDSEAKDRAAARAALPSEQRVDLTVGRIELLLADIGELNNSPAEFFKILPDILRVMEDLDLEEMIAVAEGMDAPLKSNTNDPKGVMKMMLYMLAAEQDPTRVLNVPEVAENKDLQMMMVSAMAARDPAAALKAMDDLDIDEKKRKQVTTMIAAKLFRKDVAAGLAMAREDGGHFNDLMGQTGLRMGMGSGVNDDQLPVLVEALDDPLNEEIRRNLLNVAMSSVLRSGDIEASRERIAELGIADKDVAEFLKDGSRTALAIDPAGTLQWLEETQTPEQFAIALPNAIGNWATTDYNAAGKWLGEQQPSPVLDGAIARYATTIERVDAKAAAIWAAEISDPDTRSSTLSQVVPQWQTEDEAAANAWLKENDIKLKAPPVAAPHDHESDLLIESIELE